MSMLISVHNHQQLLEDKANELGSTLNKRMDELTEMSSTMDKKIVELTSTVNKKLSSNDPYLEPQKRVEDKVDELMNTVKRQKIDSHYVHDCVQEAVTLKLQEDQEQVEEIKRRKCNVIVHGLAESIVDSASTGADAEEVGFVQLLHEIGCDDVTVSDAVRLGRKQERLHPRI